MGYKVHRGHRAHRENRGCRERRAFLVLMEKVLIPRRWMAGIRGQKLNLQRF